MKYWILMMFLGLPTAVLAQNQLVQAMNEWDDNPCKHLKPSLELASCTAQHRQEIDKKLQNTFNQAMKKNAFDANAQKHWQKSQKLWWQWVQTECAFVEERHHSSHVPVMIQACEANKMRARERHLRHKFMLESVAPSHTVVAGDTLSGIAKKYNLHTEQLKKINQLASEDKIQIGQVLRLRPVAFDMMDDTGIGMQDYGQSPFQP